MGALALSLVGTSASGAQYRLRNGIFRISGHSQASTSTETNPDAETISVELEAGGYLVELLSGWFLERVDANGDSVPVLAVLASSNPAPFTIVDQQATTVRFRFKVGEDVVEIGDGNLVIAIDVEEQAADAGVPVQNPVNGHWYQRFDQALTWHGARDYCASLGGSLATVTSEAEHEFVWGELASKTSQYCWLGATDEGAEGQWTWVTGEPFEWTHWYAGEPNNIEGVEHYLAYFKPSEIRASYWNDFGSGLSPDGLPGLCGIGGCSGEPLSTLCEWDTRP